MVETRWWWVRHGPTHQKSFVGWRDVPADLSDTAQIARLESFLPDDAIVVSSDLIRASATADAIQAGRTRLAHDAGLREMHFGDWDGKKFDEVSQRDPELSRAFWERPGDIRAPGGESWNDTAERVSKVVDRLTTLYQGRDIIAVAHIGVILTQVGRAKAQTPTQAIAQMIDNLSVSRIVHHTGSPNGWSAGVINHTP